MRKKQIIGNWKMHGSESGAIAYVKELIGRIPAHLAGQVNLAMPFTFIPCLRYHTHNFCRLGAQNMHEEREGAFTGEISCSMLLDAGAEFVLLGHSERRRLFGETNECIGRKVQLAVSEEMDSILCIGETLQERQASRTEEVLTKQLEVLLEIPSKHITRVTLAYEPIWAIGTGKSATTEQAGEVHAFCRSFLAKHFSCITAEHMSIIYGGSVSSKNARELLAHQEIDGALVGSASLDIEEFLNILKVI